MALAYFLFTNEYMNLRSYIFKLRRKMWRHDWSLQLYTQFKQVFISFSAVQIYDLSYIHLHSSPSFTFFYGYITNSQCGQLPDGLILYSTFGRLWKVYWSTWHERGTKKKSESRTGIPFHISLPSKKFTSFIDLSLLTLTSTVLILVV